MSAIAGWTAYRSRREAANRVRVEVRLQEFMQRVPIGANRKQVKNLLQAQGVPFFERCCFESNGPFSILVRVGQENAPWYCSEWPDYVAFEFSALEAPRSPLRILESDVLKLIHLTSNGEGCL
jgi:hypothetical protein